MKSTKFTKFRKNNINSSNYIYNNNNNNKMGLKTNNLGFLGIFGILLLLMLGVSGSFAQSLNETVETSTGNISFYLYSKNDNEPIQRSDLYLSTPCPENTLGWTTQEHQRNKPLYIQKVDENGVSTFENLETNQSFEFCLLRGDITGIKDDYTTNYEFKSIKKNTFLSEFDNSYNESITDSYTLYLDESDIFSFLTPQYWGFSTQQFFFIVSSFVLGGLILTYGILSGTAAGVITGGIFMMLGLTLTMLLYLLGGVL